MTEFSYKCPGQLNKSVFGGHIPRDNYRMLSLLLLLGQGKISRRNNLNSLENLLYDYSSLPYITAKNLTISEMIIKVFEMQSQTVVEDFLGNNHTKNLILHQKLYLELLSATGYMINKNPIPSFVSIYRLYEQIALSLPIISLIQKAQFFPTLDDYKQLIDSKTRSDLGVLKKYSENILEQNIGNVDQMFNFANTTRPDKCVSLLCSLIPENQRPQIILFQTHDTVSIKLKHIHTIVINFRNQYFHYLFHQRNIDYTQLPYPEEFLEVCNPLFLSFYSQMFLKLIKTEFEIWGRPRILS